MLKVILNFISLVAVWLIGRTDVQRPADALPRSQWQQNNNSQE